MKPALVIGYLIGAGLIAAARSRRIPKPWTYTWRHSSEGGAGVQWYGFGAEVWRKR